ncbi:probable protein phosphatase 2C 80 [Solanum lycopersicum]|uniref:probable protein phosphatase 2C 80 n=1 Tax=Solanum lycopersicum TaxID=4081 RepID=UPI003749DCF8
MAIDIAPPKRCRVTDESEVDVIAGDYDERHEGLTPACDFMDEDIKPYETFIPEEVDSRDVAVTGKTIMVAGSFYIPKLNPAKPLGEDASFICLNKQVIGVADGVGGWAKKGIDSGMYSRELMKNAELAIHKQSNSTTTTSSIDLMKVLNEAFSKTKNKGSSTACILSLSDDTLHAVNIGDSGFAVIREGTIVYKSKVQQSRFNCPFQLGNESTSDKPNVAEKISVPVIAGDVIVLGTDGLFDNVHDFELETIVNAGVDSWESDVPETLAWRIAQYALDNAKNTEVYTPFTRESHKAGIEHNGGKIDDITVIVAYIWPL